MFAKLLEDILSTDGHRVTAAANGVEALALLAGLAGNQQRQAREGRPQQDGLHVDLVGLALELRDGPRVRHDVLAAVEVAPPARRESHSRVRARLENAERARPEGYPERGAPA